MNHKAKRTLTALLALLTLASAFASCSGGDDTNTNDTTASDTAVSETETTAEENPEPDVSGLNYDGADFTYLIRGREATSYYEEFLYQEELNGEVVNDAVVNRNGIIEDKLGIKIRVIEANEEGNDITLAQQYVLANDNTVDVFDIRRNHTGTLAMSGYLVDFNDLDYVNLTADYWDANAVTELAIADRLFMMPCDISMANLSASRFIFFNKKLIEDYNLEEPYALVNDDKWTMDRYFEMVGAVSEDLNGDGAFDHNDRYGMLTEEGENNGTVIHMMAASNLQMTGRDDEGLPTVNVMNDKTQSVIEKVYNAL